MCLAIFRDRKALQCTYIAACGLWLFCFQQKIVYKLFAESQENINDDDPFERPSTSLTDKSVEAVQKIVTGNRGITGRIVGKDFGILVNSCHAI